MRTVTMFDVGEEVMIKVEVADISVKKGEIKYTLKDPLTAKCFDYLYTDEQIVPIPTKKTTTRSKKVSKNENSNNKS